MTKQFVKKAASIIFVFTLVFAAVLGADKGLERVSAAGETINVTITFRDGYTSAQGKVQYSADDKATWVDVTSNMNNQAVTLGATTSNLFIRIVPENGYSVDPSGTSYRENNSPTPLPLNDQANSSITGGLSGENGYQVTAGATDVELAAVEFRSVGAPGPGGGGGQNAGVGQYTVHLDNRIGYDDFPGAMWIEFYDASNQLIGDPYVYSGSTDSPQPIPSGATHLIISFPGNDAQLAADCLRFFKNGWVEVTRGENRYDFDVFDEIRDDENHVFVLSADHQIFTGAQNYVQGVDIDPTTDSINFRFEFDDTRNVSWSYDSSAPADQYVEHCRIYKLQDDDPSTILDGTDFNLRIGEPFYFLLVPDYGYQVTGLRVNGWLDIEPMNSIGVFRFDMVDSNFHFNAVVSPADDITDASAATAVSDVSIGDGANATANGGNLRVTVADATTPSGVSDVTSGTVLSTVDIDVDNIVSKGNGEYWSSDVTEISSPINVGLKLDGASDGTYAVVREHNGTLTKVDATYDADTQMLTFPSAEFSTFTIVRTGEATASEATSESDSGSTSETTETTETTEMTETSAAAPTATGPTLQSVANKPYDTGKFYADNATTPSASAVHPSSGVKITSVTAITDKNALSQLAEEVNNLYQKTQKAGINSTKSFSMDVQATGSGKVSFDVGVTGTAAAVISHFHGGRWTRQIVDVVNGQATGTFGDFSPVYITVYEGVTANQLRAAGITETEFTSSSPKTGHQDDLTIALLIVVVAASAMMLYTIRGKKKKEE
ncbi:MAG: hypothetical protein K6A05_00020 [Lachnospiraceae bacterium]|nr:hypothetical protein [Lachnospiraceae bacterium]